MIHILFVFWLWCKVISNPTLPLFFVVRNHFCFRYMKLVKKTDADEYQSSKFQHHRVDNFLLIIITKNKFPPDPLLEQTYPIRIVLPST